MSGWMGFRPVRSRSSFQTISVPSRAFLTRWHGLREVSLSRAHHLRIPRGMTTTSTSVSSGIALRRGSWRGTSTSTGRRETLSRGSSRGTPLPGPISRTLRISMGTAYSRRGRASSATISGSPVRDFSPVASGTPASRWSRRRAGSPPDGSSSLSRSPGTMLPWGYIPLCRTSVRCGSP